MQNSQITRKSEIELLKRVLRHEVTILCRHDSTSWKKGITETVDELRSVGREAVFFGGTLRTLLLSRLMKNSIGRPRDVDIVVRGVELDDLKSHFSHRTTRQTRFGGLHIHHTNWQFDVWPLGETYALKSHGVEEPTFDDLPKTTFLNLEAIAVEVWPRKGQPRRIYSGNDQFFGGVISRLIDLNNEENPFPELCLVRSLVIGNYLGWKLSRRLGKYIATHGESLSESDLEDIQRNHYGSVIVHGAHIRQWIDILSTALSFSLADPIGLPWNHQLELWPDEIERSWPCIRMSVLNRNQSQKDPLKRKTR